MSRVRLALAVFIVVLSVSATASSAAMAAGWAINGTILSGTAPVASTDEIDELVFFSFSVSQITCNANTLSTMAFQIQSPNSLSASSLVFKECAVTSGGECSLTSGPTIGTLPVTSEITLDGSSGARGTFKPKTVTTFATIKLQGANCAETGKVPITGKIDWLAPTLQNPRAIQLVSIHVTEESSELHVGSTFALLKASFLLDLSDLLPWAFV